MIEDVLDSQVDLGIVVSTDYDSHKLKVECLSTNQRLVLVVASTSPIAHRSRLEYINLCGYPLIVGPETSATRRVMLKKLRLGGCATPVPIIVEVNNAEWGVNLVENGGGIGLYHEKVVAKAVEEGRLKVLPLSSEILVGVDAITRSDGPEHPMVRKFVDIVRDILSRETPSLKILPEPVEAGYK